MKKMGCVILILFIVALAMGIIGFSVLSHEKAKSDDQEAKSKETQQEMKAEQPKEEAEVKEEAKAKEAKTAKKKLDAKKSKSLEEQRSVRPGAEHVYSHRGASGEAEEHSFAAYDLAIDYGSINIEQDVVTSADGTLYVSHDTSPQRLTGVSGKYSEMTDEEIDALRTKEGNRILKLSEVFDRYGDSVNYIIELKSKDPGAVDAFRKLVDEYGNQDRIVVQCFSDDVLKELERYYPKMPRLYLCETQEAFEEGCQLPCVDILGVDKALMTEDNCKHTHQCGKEFDVWVLNTEDEICDAIDMGVDTYFTNYTKRALDLEEEWR